MEGNIHLLASAQFQPHVIYWYMTFEGSTTECYISKAHNMSYLFSPSDFDLTVCKLLIFLKLKIFSGKLSENYNEFVKKNDV